MKQLIYEGHVIRIYSRSFTNTNGNLVKRYDYFVHGPKQLFPYNGTTKSETAAIRQAKMHINQILFISNP
jgi:hypothetical protein